MILDEVKPHDLKFKIDIQNLLEKEANLDKWLEHPTSELLHHHDECCDHARLWFLATARSMEIWTLAQFQVKTPVWLSKIFTWGPSKWPIFWCEVMKTKVVDCGVFAALSLEVFKAQGQPAYAAQALVNYNETCTQHWKDLWANGCLLKDGKMLENTFPWIGSSIVYHELCVVELPGRKAKIYDSTFGNWLEPHKRMGFGSLMALRTECPRVLTWEDKVISYGEWVYP